MLRCGLWGMAVCRCCAERIRVVDRNRSETAERSTICRGWSADVDRCGARIRAPVGVCGCEVQSISAGTNAPSGTAR